MIHRAFLDADGTPLLNLYRYTPDKALMTKSETLPDLTPVGQVEDVPGTGLRIYTGPELLRAGTLTVSLGTNGRDHFSLVALHDTVLRAAVRARGYLREGRVLPLARFSKISRSYQGSAQLGGQVDVTFEAASAFFFGPAREEVVVSGVPEVVTNDGFSRASLMVVITAGVSDIVNPTIQTAAGVTTWNGTLPAGGVLTIDGTAGVWAVILDGMDVRLNLTGPQPYLAPGENTVTLTADGATAVLSWQEGGLV